MLKCTAEAVVLSLLPHDKRILTDRRAVWAVSENHLDIRANGVLWARKIPVISKRACFTSVLELVPSTYPLIVT
jgi:hypothetical protein